MLQEHSTSSEDIFFKPKVKYFDNKGRCLNLRSK